MRARIGSGYRYTDLERLRLDWFIRETTLSVREIAAKLERSEAGLRKYMYSQGIWISEERKGERAWSGV